MSLAQAKPSLKLLALGKGVFFFFPQCLLLTSSCWTDGGSIHKLSELLMIKEIMHRLMIKENIKHKSNSQPLLTSLSQTMWLLWSYWQHQYWRVSSSLHCTIFISKLYVHLCRIIALMLGHLRMGVDTAIGAYSSLVQQVFSAQKQWSGDGRGSKQQDLKKWLNLLCKM